MTGYSMMVVDDEKKAREHVLKHIAWDRLSVNTLYQAADGGEALELVERVHPDIIILDIRMPGMDGLTFLNRVRESGEQPQIIALSGYSDFHAAREMLSSGLVVDYLLKPASEDAMFEAVYRCIARVEERQRITELEEDLDKAREALRKLNGRAEPVKQEDAPTGHKAVLVRDVKRYLSEHYAERITLEDAAQRVYINATYLSRIFSEVEQVGFSDYLTALRIQKATELLGDYHLKIYEIAEMVGYRNVKHFINLNYSR